MKKKKYSFKTNVRYLHNAEHLAMHGDISQHVKTEVAKLTDAKIREAADAYEAAYNHEDLVINPEKGSPETPVINIEEELRDADLTYIIETVDAAAKYPKIADRHAAAKILKSVLDSYKGIKQLSQTDETGLINKLLKSLDETTNKSAVNTLGLQSTVDSLKANNEDFQAHWDNRALSDDEKRKHGKTRDSRANADDKLDELTDQLASSYNAGYLPEASQKVVGDLLDFINAKLAAQIGVLSHRDLKNRPHKPDPGEDEDGGAIPPPEPPPFG